MGLLKREDSPTGERVLASSRLSSDEADRYAKLKSTIDQTVAAYFPAGRALEEILRRKLFRADHPTFEQLVDREWSMSPTHARRLIAGYQIATVLVDAGLPRPKAESIVRPLTKCKPPMAIAVWEKLTAGNKSPTATQVATAVEQMSPKRMPKARKKPRPVIIKVSGAKVTVVATGKAPIDIGVALREALNKHSSASLATKKAA